MISKQLGFTLIELMVAVLIVGVLVAIAYPSYKDSVRKSQRAYEKEDILETLTAPTRELKPNSEMTGGSKGR